MKYLLSLVTLCSAASFAPMALAQTSNSLDPATAIALFKKSDKVTAAIKALTDAGFKVLEAPQASVFQVRMTDEGPMAKYLVSTLLQKDGSFLEYRAEAVTAVVTTDHFGTWGARLVDSEAVAKALEGVR